MSGCRGVQGCIGVRKIRIRAQSSLYVGDIARLYVR